MVLVAVNPYELYPIYGTEHIDKYSQQTDMTLLPPHIFSTAQYAFTSMKRRLQNQSIIIRYNVKSFWKQVMILSDLHRAVFIRLLKVIRFCFGCALVPRAIGLKAGSILGRYLTPPVPFYSQVYNRVSAS